jgi:hypothetical protein
MQEIDPLLKFEIDKAFGPITYRPYRLDGARILLTMLFKKQVKRLSLTIADLVDMLDKNNIIDSINKLALFFQVLLCMK